MNKYLLIALHMIMWFCVWIVIAGLQYIMNQWFNTTTDVSLYSCIFDRYTIAVQFMIGWMVPVVILEEERKKIGFSFS